MLGEAIPRFGIGNAFNRKQLIKSEQLILIIPVLPSEKIDVADSPILPSLPDGRWLVPLRSLITDQFDQLVFRQLFLPPLFEAECFPIFEEIVALYFFAVGGLSLQSIGIGVDIVCEFGLHSFLMVRLHHLAIIAFNTIVAVMLLAGGSGLGGDCFADVGTLAVVGWL